MEFPIGKKFFHLVVNPGTSRCPAVDVELVQNTRNVHGTRHSVRKFQPGKRAHLFRGAFHLGKNPEISVGAKVEFPIGKKLFHFVVNPGTSLCPTVAAWNWYKLLETGNVSVKSKFQHPPSRATPRAFDFSLRIIVQILPLPGPKCRSNAPH